MARIRNIKPDIFRHEALQDLESDHPGAHIILTYIALWTQCDKNGVFAWKPRTMRLDILPFLQINIEKNLQTLLDAGYIQTFETEGNKYGYIPTFTRHQVLPTKEKVAPAKYPPPPGTAPEQPRNSPGTSEEGNRNKEEGRGRADNARAHETENQNQKPAEQTPPPQPSNAGGQTVTDIYAIINAHCNTDDGLRELVAWKKQAGYSDRIHGPTTGEVTKFIEKYLDRIRATDPVQYFRDHFAAWLVRATEYNRPKKDALPKYEPPTHFTRRSPSEGGQRTNGNANGITTIGDIAGKIISEI